MLLRDPRDVPSAPAASLLVPTLVHALLLQAGAHCQQPDGGQPRGLPDQARHVKERTKTEPPPSCHAVHHSPGQVLRAAQRLVGSHWPVRVLHAAQRLVCSSEGWLREGWLREGWLHEGWLSPGWRPGDSAVACRPGSVGSLLHLGAAPLQARVAARQRWAGGHDLRAGWAHWTA